MNVKKNVESRSQATLFALLLLIGWLLGLLTTTLYWKDQTEKEIEKVLTGYMVTDGSGKVYVINSGNK
jgi:hypothetical protein